MRELYAVPDEPYFLSHSVGCLPKAAEQVLAESYLSPWKKSGGDAWPSWMNVLAEFQAELTTLLGGQPQEYCPQVNLSSGLTKFLLSLPRNPQKNKVVMHAHAFPSMGFVVKALEDCGYELVLISDKHAADDLNVWEDVISDDVCAVVISHVYSNTGVCSPVAELCALCRIKGVYSILDVAQSAGIVPMDINYWHVDVVLGSCVKWLCGGPGAGYMRVNANLLKQLKPVDVGWFSHTDPFEFDINRFEYAEDARRFMGGTPSIAPYALALGSIRQVNQIGVDKIFNHNRKLSNKVLNAAQGKLERQIDLNRNGGTLCMTFETSRADKLESALKQKGAYFDRRKNTLRFSLHIYNTEEEAELLAEVIDSL